jgi:hypothetical protein
VGDASITGLGVLTCHEQVMLYNPKQSKAERFQVIAEGMRETSTTTVAVRKGNLLGSCEIAGVGEEIAIDTTGACVPSCGDFDPNQTLTRTEILNFKGCRVEFTFDLTTGAVESAVPLDPLECDFYDLPAEQFQVIVDGVTLNTTFGDGILSAGDNSCTCRSIGRRVYCWGKSCP